jgi:polar amino acid transport system substrate-binding protein
MALALILGAGSIPSGHAAAQKLTVAALVDYPPFSDIGRPQLGFANELFTTAIRRAGYEVEIVMLPWSRALAGMQNGTYDILTCVWKTPEREKSMVFTAPFAVNRLVFAQRAHEDFVYQSLADLTGRTIGTIPGYAYDEAFLTATNFKREEAANVATNLRKLSAGRIDLTVEDELILRFIINTQLPDLKMMVDLAPGALSENPLHFAVSRRRPDAEKVASAFNAALAAMRGDGSYDHLLEKHGMR